MEMEERKKMDISLIVGEKAVLGSYWLQMLPDEQTIIALYPANARIILRLAEFSGEGEPDTTTELLNETDLVMTLYRMRKAKGWGTTEPIELGIIGNVRILGSFLITPFYDSVQLQATFYGELVQEETSEDGKRAGETDLEKANQA